MGAHLPAEGRQAPQSAPKPSSALAVVCSVSAGEAMHCLEPVFVAELGVVRQAAAVEPRIGPGVRSQYLVSEDGDQEDEKEKTGYCCQEPGDFGPNHGEASIAPRFFVNRYVEGVA